MKLEIGCGHNPYPGYVHLDVLPLPHVDIICDITKQKIPLDDNSVDEILHNHVLEHIPWREVTAVLQEMRRVLKPNGKMIFRTPNLAYICGQYLNRNITPQYPSDVEKLKEVFGEFGPSQWAIVKLFSGQDYPSNFHYCCYDLESITALLTKNGFTDIRPVQLSPIHSDGELQIFCIKKST